MHSQSYSYTKNESGNVILLVLIGIALFAALSYAVTQSAGGSQNNPDSERLRLETSRLIEYITSLRTAVTRLRYAKGCDPEEISFHYDSDGDGSVDGSDDYNNPNAPSDGSCNIFGRNGGGLTWLDYDNSDLPDLFGVVGFVFSGTIAVEEMGTPAPELTARLFVSEEMCNRVNTELGLETGYFDTFSNGTYDEFLGTYSLESIFGDESGSDRLPPNLPTACFRRDNPQTQYVFYAVLLSR